MIIIKSNVNLILCKRYFTFDFKLLDMENIILFPHRLKTLGYILAFTGVILGYLLLFCETNISILSYKEPLNNISFLSLAAYGNFTDELAMISIIIGLFLVAFSKEKTEDEMITRIRVNSLYWAVIFNYFLYFLATLYSYLDGEILRYLYLFNLFTPLLIFIFRFNYLMRTKNGESVISSPKLLPYKPFRLVSIMLVLISISILVLSTFLEISYYNIVLATYGLIAGLFLFTHSRNFLEDELLIHNRILSIFWAITIYYIIIIPEILFLYEYDFFNAMLYDVFLPLSLFVVIWTYLRLKQNNFKWDAAEIL